MEYIYIFGIDHSKLKQTNVIEFDIDTGDAVPFYIKSRPLPYKYKDFVKCYQDRKSSRFDLIKLIFCELFQLIFLRRFLPFL